MLQQSASALEQTSEGVVSHLQVDLRGGVRQKLLGTHVACRGGWPMRGVPAEGF